MASDGTTSASWLFLSERRSENGGYRQGDLAAPARQPRAASGHLSKTRNAADCRSAPLCFTVGNMWGERRCGAIALCMTIALSISGCSGLIEAIEPPAL